MPHIHITADGDETSPEITEEELPDVHWHVVADTDGAITSKDPFGENHTHTFRGAMTSKPISTR